MMRANNPNDSTVRTRQAGPLGRMLAGLLVLAGAHVVAQAEELYHTNRVFTPITINASPARYSVTTMAGKLTEVIKGEDVRPISNQTYATEYEAMAWGYVSAPEAWNAVVANYALHSTQHQAGVYYDNAGWVKGTRQVTGPDGTTWGAYLWLLQNHIAFQSSTTTLWRTPEGGMSIITQVLVRSLGDYPPKQNVTDVGPIHDPAGVPFTENPGANQSEDLSMKPDLTTYYQVGVLKVELESDRAVNSPTAFTMGQTLDDPCEFAYGPDSQRQALEELEQKKIDSSLTVLFKDASDGQGNVEEFDVTLKVTPEIQGVTWEKISGPQNSGTLIDADKAVAIFRNPTKGGKYVFDATLPGGQKVRTQLWLPVSGPDIDDNFQNEIDYLKADWGPRYTGNLAPRLAKKLPWYILPGSQEYAKQQAFMLLGDIIGFGLDFDYVLRGYINDVCGLAHIAGPNSSAGDRERFSLPGASKWYVIDFAKRSNMGYAMVARSMGFYSIVIKEGPDLYLKWVSNDVGTKDSVAARESYDAGIAIIDGDPLQEVMDDHGLAMQEPLGRARKEWPSPDTAQFPYVELQPNTKLKMEALTVAP